METVLVRGRVLIDFDAHLARLQASTQALYGARLGGDVARQAHELAARAPTGGARLRVVARPGRDALDVDMMLAGLPTGGPLHLRHVVLPGGLGQHKWADRDLLEKIAGRLAGAAALLVDADGYVLEAAYANVMVLRGCSLLTPPLDGRILPGTTRAQLIRMARARRFEVSEQTVTIDDLLSADAVLLVSSLRGAVPAASVDGRAVNDRRSSLIASDKSGFLQGCLHAPARDLRPGPPGRPVQLCGVAAIAPGKPSPVRTTLPAP